MLKTPACRQCRGELDDIADFIEKLCSECVYDDTLEED